MRKLSGIVILVLEFGFAAYLAVIAWLWSMWVFDDPLAAWMLDAHWEFATLMRWLEGTAVACAFGLATYLVNGVALRDLSEGRPRLRVGVSAGLTAIIAAAALIGGVVFALVTIMF